MVNSRSQSVLTKVKVALLLLFILCTGKLHAQVKSAKAGQPDTFKIANRFIAKKKYRKANAILKKYNQAHPNDMNAHWLRAQSYLWLTNNKRSDQQYTEARKLEPGNDYLNLNYIQALLYMGRYHAADSLMGRLEDADQQYASIAYMRAQQSYWMGDYRRAAAYIKQAIREGDKDNEARGLCDQIAIARAPLLSFSTSYLSDNQPLTAVISSIKLEKYFHKLLTLYVAVDEYHFIQNRMSDAPWVRVGDKLYFPKAGIKLTAEAGIMKFPVMNTVSATGNLDMNIRVSRQFDITLSGGYVPYLDTKTSIDTNVTATKLAAMLNWHKRKWLGQAALLNTIFPGNNNVYSAYAYVMAPIAGWSWGQFNIGYSTSYSNSDKNSYTAINSLHDIFAAYNASASIPGIYSPYFAPSQLYVNAGLASLELNMSKKLTLRLSGDVGYGSIWNPYLYLNKDPGGNVYVAKGYSMESFTPSDVTAALSFKINKTWLLTAKYMYRNTYFFTSNYGSIGVSKSFLHTRIDWLSDSSGHSFSRSVKELDGQIQDLYSALNAVQLKGAVAEVEMHITNLIAANKAMPGHSEILQNSELSDLSQARYDALNDMLSELHSISLDDYDASAGTKSQWLTEKLYELTAIRYNGPTNENVVLSGR